MLYVYNSIYTYSVYIPTSCYTVGRGCVHIAGGSAAGFSGLLDAYRCKYFHYIIIIIFLIFFSSFPFFPPPPSLASLFYNILYRHTAKIIIIVKKKKTHTLTSQTLCPCL